MLDSGTDQEILKIKKYLAQLFLQLQLLMGFKSTSGWCGSPEAKCQAVRGKRQEERACVTGVTNCGLERPWLS